MLREPDEDPEEGLQVLLTQRLLSESGFGGGSHLSFVWSTDLSPLCSCLFCGSASLRLLEYLQAMRNYFLLEAGDTMYDFYTAIFDKVREKENWQQLSFLNVQLQEAVRQRHPEDSSR